MKGSIQERSHLPAPNGTKHSQNSIGCKIRFSSGQWDKFAITHGQTWKDPNSREATCLSQMRQRIHRKVLVAKFDFPMDSVASMLSHMDRIKGSIQERSHFSAPNATKYSQKSIKWKIWFSCGQCDKFAMTRGNWHFLHSCFPRIYKFRKIDTTSHILSLKVLTNFMLALLTGHWHKQILTNLNKK